MGHETRKEISRSMLLHGGFDHPVDLTGFNLRDKGHGLEYLRTHGPQTVSGTGLGSRFREVERIHQENLTRLSNMSEDEIANERELLLSSMNPSMVAFLLHKNRRNIPTNGRSSQKEQVRSRFSRSRGPTSPLSDDPLVMGVTQLEVEKLEWTRDLPVTARRPPELHVVPGSQQCSSEDIEMNEPHPENKTIKPCQARFDLCGLVVPPEAVLDTHLGLHHHGEEPERAGYTIGELFHLSRSSVPAQRRLALATLATALGQTRRGRHVHNLAPVSSPSLIWGLLSSSSDPVEGDGPGSGGGKGGVAFLLRWCLDESTYLNSTHEWPLQMATKQHLFLAPPTLQRKVPSKIPGVLQLTKSGTEEEPDHSEAMSLDPVLFLFTQGQLGQRLAWLLSDEKGNLRTKLPPDAVGLWLPALLIRAVRHSSALAYRVFSIPNLFRTLLDHYLPVCHGTDSSLASAVRPTRLSQATGIPFAAVMLLCRLTMLTSTSIRLAMVNDLRLVERCCSYLIPSEAEVAQGGNHLSEQWSPFSRLPPALPLKLAAQVHIEALRCLSTCLVPVSDAEPIPLHALNCIWNTLPILCATLKRMVDTYFEHFGTPRQPHTEDVLILPQLLVSWISFLTQAFESFALGSRKITNWSVQSFHECIDELFRHILQVLGHILSKFTCGFAALEEIHVHLSNHGITANLVAVVVDCSLRLLDAQQRVDRLPQTPPFFQRIETLWTTYLLPLFSHDVWSRTVGRFVRSRSVLTGVPEMMADVDVVTVPRLPSVENDPNPNRPVINWTNLSSSTSIDEGLLEPVDLAPRCLPDLGTRVCFRHRTADPGLAAFVWPKSGIRMEDDCNPLSPAPGDFCSLALLTCTLSALERILLKWRFHLASDSVSPHVFAPLIGWIRRLATKRPLPWLSGSTITSLPYALIAMESYTVGRAVLVLSQMRLYAETTTKERVLFRLMKVLVEVEQYKGEHLDSRMLRHIGVTRCGRFRTNRSSEKVASSDAASGLDDQFLHNVLQVYRKYSCGTNLEGLVEDAAKETRDSHLPTLSEESDMDQNQLVVGRACHPPADVSRIQTPINCSISVASSLLPHDWSYAPLIGQYLQAKRLANAGITASSNETEQQKSLFDLTVGLRWLLFLYQVHFCQDSPGNCGILDPLAHLARLSLGCLGYAGAGGLGFGQSGILLAKLIHLVGSMCRLQQNSSRPYSLETVDLPPFCASFYDVYTDLLGHFAALSYNSPVFANLILWPCQQFCHMKYRRALWGEYQSALVAVRLRLDQLLLPVDSFLDPEETDESVLRVYASALLSGGVRVDRQPLLFLIAVHHINRYLYHTQNIKSAFVQQFSRLVRAAPRHQDSNRQKPATSLRASVLDVIQHYKQPNSVWTRQSPQILPDDCLAVGVTDPLVVCRGAQHMFESDSAVPFTTLVTNAGIECYSPDQLPAHRKTFWDQYIST
ncbi:RNA polymerase II-associated protein 1 [Clonorchis sinensis]|uniref:RNA polymerase II-associated protein 1 n=1 Tax=Clonorchis sinensis TaxID=79923 RepID=G7YF77_CLOSI|nr:RNA polymerase II-associated protein 1 [Clonorchis sinensis]